MPPTLALTVWTIAGALLSGLLLALLGSLKMAVARRPQRVTSPLALLLFLLNVLLVPLLVLSGLVIDQWGLRPVMVGAPVLLALAFLALSAGVTYGRAQMVVTVAGLAASGIITASVILMPRAFFGEQDLVASLQMGLVFVGLGALLSAPLIEVLFAALGFRRGMALFALVSLTLAFLAALPTHEQLDLHPPANALSELLDDSGMWLGCLVFFCYAPLEGFVSIWVSTHLATLGEPPRRANRLLFSFWLTALVSRLLLAVILHSADLRDTLYPPILVTLAFLVAVVLGNLAATSRTEGMAWGLVFLGLFLGPIYPFLVGLLFGTSAGKAMPGTAYGLLCASGSVGGLVLSPLVGFCAHSRNRLVALLIPMFLALILTAAALLFGLRAGT